LTARSAIRLETSLTEVAASGKLLRVRPLHLSHGCHLLFHLLLLLFEPTLLHSVLHLLVLEVLLQDGGLRVVATVLLLSVHIIGTVEAVHLQALSLHLQGPDLPLQRLVALLFHVKHLLLLLYLLLHSRIHLRGSLLIAVLRRSTLCELWLMHHLWLLICRSIHSRLLLEAHVVRHTECVLCLQGWIGADRDNGFEFKLKVGGVIIVGIPEQFALGGDPGSHSEVSINVAIGEFVCRVKVGQVHHVSESEVHLLVRVDHWHSHLILHSDYQCNLRMWLVV